MNVPVGSSSRCLNMVEVEGTEIKGTLNAPARETDKDSVIRDLNAIINQKNATIEQQMEYIVDLQLENSNLRHKIKLLSL